MMARVERYIKEEVKERFIDGLRPKHKKPVFKKRKRHQENRRQRRGEKENHQQAKSKSDQEESRDQSLSATKA